MVKLIDLKESEQRRVRKVIPSPLGDITIFEPTIDEYDKVLQVQREKGMTNEDSVEFDDVTVLKELFPILTDLDMSGATDEEIQSVIDNPTIQVLAVQNVVSQIVSEINVLFLERMKTELIQAQTAVSQVELLNMIPQLMKKEAKNKDDGKAIKNLKVIEKEITAEV